MHIGSSPPISTQRSRSIQDVVGRPRFPGLLRRSAFEFARGRPCAEVEAGLRPLGASPPARRGVPCPIPYPYRYPWPRCTRQRQAQPRFLSREQLTIYQVGSYQAVEVEAHGT